MGHAVFNDQIQKVDAAEVFIGCIGQGSHQARDPLRSSCDY